MRASSAASRVHGGERFGCIGENHIAGSFDGTRGGCARRRRLAQKLTMGSVAEIEIIMASVAGDKVGASGDRLRFECLEWRVGRVLGGHDGSDGDLWIHGHDREQMPAGWPNLEYAVIMASDLSWNGKDKIRGFVPASRDCETVCEHSPRSRLKNHLAAVDPDGRTAKAGTILQHKALVPGADDKRVSLGRADGKLARMKEAENSDADVGRGTG